MGGAESMTSTPASTSLIARLGTGCLLQVLLFAFVAAANHRLLTPAVPDPRLRLGLALVSALFVWVGLANFWALAQDLGRGESSRRALLRRARTGEEPTAGGPVVATGSIRALSAPLSAPLSGVPCVAYTYRMYRVWRDADGDRNEVPVYWGYASTPFALDGSAGRARILAAPRIVTKAAVLAGPDAEDRARRFVGSASFEQVQGRILGAVGTALATAREIFTDEDGKTRRDWHAAGDDAVLSSLILEEAALPVGALASVHGTWSAERGAIVAGDDPALALGVSAALGPPEDLGDVLPRSTAVYLATAVISSALGAGILWFALEMLPALV